MSMLAAPVMEHIEYNTPVRHDGSAAVLFALCCERVQRAHLSLSHPGWPSWAGLSPSRSRSCTAAAPPSGQTRRPSSAAGRTRSSRSSSGGRRTPERASQTLWGRSSPCSRCTWSQTTYAMRQKGDCRCADSWRQRKCSRSKPKRETSLD